jgi:antitoxin component YwqK of YwqJK toxin-antitoxin module
MYNFNRYTDTIYSLNDTFIYIKSYFTNNNTPSNFIKNTKRTTINGNIIEEYNEYKTNIIGLHQMFYTNGILKQVSMYDDGRLFGLFISYYENGLIKEIGNYKKLSTIDNEKISTDTIKKLDNETGEILEIITEFKRPIKEGKWIYYNDKGDIKKEEEYDNEGTLIIQKKY